MHVIAQYAKAIAGLVAAILVSVSTALPEVPTWVTIGIAVAGAIAVYVWPNAPTEAQKDVAIQEAIEDVNSPVTIVPLGSGRHVA